MQGILLKARFPEAKRVNRPFKRQQSQPHCYVNFFCAPRGLLSVSYNTSPTESLTQCAETTAAAPLKGADRFVWQSHTVTYTHISSDLLFLGCQLRTRFCHTSPNPAFSCLAALLYSWGQVHWLDRFNVLSGLQV